MAQRQGLFIQMVSPESIGEEIGLKPGQQITYINGQKISDLIDYRYMVADDYLEIQVIDEYSETLIYEIEKDYDEDLGVSFAAATADGIRPCQNRCLFCFVDQMPPNMRSSLYVKDDDYRFSFMHGNFVTMTNITKDDLDRILTLRLSPLYISVHATDPQVRIKLLNNSKAGDILDKIELLSTSQIEMHTQIVLCPGINDEQILDKSIKDLSNLYPNVLSLAIVPVGTTKYRDKLTSLQVVDSPTARRALQQIHRWQNKLKSKIGTNFVFASDEFYVLTDWPVPPAADYEEFPQIENGVGITRLFLDDLEYSDHIIPNEISKEKIVSIAHGPSAKKVVNKLVNRLSLVKNLKVLQYSVPHRFWGEHITVTGLLTGSDLLSELGDKILGEVLYLPEVMVRKEGGLFLDDMTIEEVSSKLNIDIVIVSGIEDLLKKIFKEESR